MNPEFEIFVANEQDEYSLDLPLWLELAKGVCASEGCKGPGELSLLFVDEGAMSELNERYMAKSGPTDVLSFPIAQEPMDSGRSPDGGGSGPSTAVPLSSTIPYLLGDVVLCPVVADHAAKDHIGDRGHNGTFEDEIALLLIHGILHLRGMDHVEDEDAVLMESKEADLLSRLYHPLRDRILPEKE